MYPPGLEPPEAEKPPAQPDRKKINALDFVAQLNKRFATTDEPPQKRRDRDRERDYGDDRKRSRRSDRRDKGRDRDRDRGDKNRDRDRNRSRRGGDGERFRGPEENDRFDPKASKKASTSKESSSFERFKPPARNREKSAERTPGQPPADWPGPDLTREKPKPAASVRPEPAREERPNPAAGRTPQNAGLSNKLWIEGLKRGSNDTIKTNFTLRELFGKYGTVDDLEVKITTTSRLKGSAVVTMATPAGATEAARYLNDFNLPEHGPLKVDIVDPNRHYAKKGGRRGGGRGRGRGRGGGRDFGGRDRNQGGGRDSGGYRGGRGGGRNYGGRDSGGYGGGRGGGRRY